MKQKFIFVLLLFFILVSCVDVVDTDLPESDKHLVVEGLVTDQDTAYIIKLSKTSKYSFYNKYPSEKETSATLIISDNAGNRDTLKEKGEGFYWTDPAKLTGRAGRSYKLDILLKDGRHYASNWEEMIEVPKIDSIYFERDNKDRKGINAYKNYVYLDWQDPAGVSNYYLHNFSFYWNNIWHDENQWNNFFNDNTIDGKYLKKFGIYNSYDGRNFTVRIKRYSLTKRAYEFWNLLSKQINPRTDGIVNTSVPLIGNVCSASNPEDYALGYFQVSAMSMKTIYIDR